MEEKDNLASQKKWIKQNKKKLGCSFDAELIDKFKAACDVLGTEQTPIIISAIKKTIKEVEDRKMEIKYNVHTGWIKSIDESPSNEDDAYFDNFEEAKKCYDDTDVSGNEFKILEKVVFENGIYYDQIEEMESTYSDIYDELFN